VTPPPKLIFSPMGFTLEDLGHVAIDQPTGEVLHPHKSVVIRFPTGDFEYNVTRRVAPSIGETVRREGFSGPSLV
jgi:hypothetical protein